jgi:ribosomal protein S18 acetylase RimI-like enzyme
MNAKIRFATLDDVIAVAQLQHEFVNEHAKLYDSKFYALSDSSVKQWSGWAEAKFKSGSLALFVAEKNGAEKDILVGYVSGWVETRPPIYILDKIGYLSNIYVVPAHRRQGIGKLLNSALLDWFRNKGLDYVELYVDSRANDSVDSWTRMGYSEVGKRMRINL